MQQLEKILARYGFDKREGRPDPSIEEIERAIGFSLPADYRWFLAEYNCFEGIIRHEFVRLWEAGGIIEANNDYGILGNLPGTVAIGSNGGGEFIAIERVDPGDYRIVLSPFADIDSEYHIGIGASFTDFLERLDRGQEWLGEDRVIK
jgi:hypothetical protein